MTHIERLANEIAILSNDSLSRLATELVKEYPTRATTFEFSLSVEIQDATIKQDPWKFVNL
jgi:hypothetical protein